MKPFCTSHNFLLVHSKTQDERRQIGYKSRMFLKFGFFTTLLMIAIVLGEDEDKTKKQRLSPMLSQKMMEDRRLREDVNGMNDRGDYVLSLSESSVITGMTSKFKSKFKNKNGPYRTFESKIWVPFSNIETSKREFLHSTTHCQDFENKCVEDMFVTEIIAMYQPNEKCQFFKFGCSSFLHVSTVDCKWSDFVNDVNEGEDFAFECEENDIISGVKSKFSETSNDRSFSFYCCGYYQGKWPKDKVEEFAQRYKSESENSRKQIANFFDDLKKISTNCENFVSNFEVNVCEMEGGFGQDNSRGFDETLEDRTKRSELRAKKETFQELILDNNKIDDKEVKTCHIERTVMPKTKKANFQKEISILLADPNYNEEDFKDAADALDEFKYCTEGMLDFVLDVHKIDVDVSDMHWEEAAFEVMQKAREDLGIEFKSNERLSGHEHLMVDFNLDKYMVMVVLPDNVDFGDKYGFALMHSGFSIIKTSATLDGRHVLHEVGHNLGMMHSSTANNEYGDDKCIMGQTKSIKTCFNGAKSDYLGLYRQDTGIVHAQNHDCDATLLLADLQQYLFNKRDIHNTHGTFYVIVKVPDVTGNTYFTYDSDDGTISVVRGGIEEIYGMDLDALLYATESMRLFELKRGEEKEHYGVFYRHCAHIDSERVATLHIRTYPNAACDDFTSEIFNLALGRPSRMSSDYDRNKWPKSFGNDGDTSVVGSHTGFIYTNDGRYEFWEVTLASEISIIDQVVIYNRADCCSERIVGGEVEIYDSKGNVVATRPITHNSIIIKVDFGGIEGAVVRISPRAYQPLHIRECVVNGREYLGSSPSAIPPLFTKVVASEFLHLKGAELVLLNTKDARIGRVHGDAVMYSRLCNFGSIGTTKFIQFRYGKGYHASDKVEVRLDEINGELIGSLYTKYTGGWGTYITESIAIKDVHGIHSVVLVAKGSYGIFDLVWFKLSAPFELSATIPPLFTKVVASEFLHLEGAQLVLLNTKDARIGRVHGNAVMYSRLCNFGSIGTTKSIQFRYGKGNHASDKVEVRLDEINGKLIGSLYTKYTGGWGTYITESIAIKDVHGIHSVVLVAKGSFGIFDLVWFELSATIPPLFTKVVASEFLLLKGAELVLLNTKDAQIGRVHGNAVMYSRLCNFGSIGTTKTIQFRYGKGNHASDRVEVRLDEINGELIGSLYTKYTGGWGTYITESIAIKDVHGIHSVVLVAKGSYGIFDLVWFKLSATE